MRQSTPKFNYPFSNKPCSAENAHFRNDQFQGLKTVVLDKKATSIDPKNQELWQTVKTQAIMRQ